MKVILLRDVAKLGKRFSIIDTPDGYALNKLIPQGLAQPATPENVKRVEARAKGVAEHAHHDAEALKAVMSQLETSPLVLTMEANAQGHLFKAVKAADLVEAAKALGLTLPEPAIRIPEPIKSIGEHTVQIAQGAVKGTITIAVNAK
jgi:large subunit ribosomal protein L9